MLESPKSDPETSRLAGAYFIIQGIGCLLPFNGILTTLDFYEDKFPNGRVSFVFPIVALLAAITINLFMVVIRSKLSLNVRIGYCNLLTIVFLIIIPVLTAYLPLTESKKQL